jgi:hypothetical protein
VQAWNRIIRIWGSISALLLCCTITSAQQGTSDQKTVGVRVICDDERYGSAVIVQDFRSGVTSGSLVLTALHVVQGC